MKAYVLKGEHGYATGPIWPGAYATELSDALMFASLEEANETAVEGVQVVELNVSEVGVSTHTKKADMAAEPNKKKTAPLVIKKKGISLKKKMKR